MRLRISWLVLLVMLMGTAVSAQAGQTNLIEYSQETFAAAKNDKRVLFFHASWCPSCVASAKAVDRLVLPDDVKVFKLDYDSHGDLKKKYDVIYQDTFIQVGPAGEKVAQWSGNAEDLLSELR